MTTGSISAKAGLIAREIVAKGIIGCFGYGFGTMIYSQSHALRLFEVLLQKSKGNTEKCEGMLRFLDKSEQELVQLEEYYKKKMDEYWIRASKKT